MELVYILCCMDIKPKWGRGHRAPYETVMVRTPVPIKAEVEAVIARYRDSVLSGSPVAIESDVRYAAIRLLNLFVNEVGINTDSLTKPTRDNVNLLRFLRWLESKETAETHAQ
jgi:hypothetical protein